MLDVRRSFITLSCSKYEWQNSANKDVKNTNIKSTFWNDNIENLQHIR